PPCEFGTHLAAGALGASTTHEGVTSPVISSCTDAPGNAEKRAKPCSLMNQRPSAPPSAVGYMKWPLASVKVSSLIEPSRQRWSMSVFAMGVSAPASYCP